MIVTAGACVSVFLKHESELGQSGLQAVDHYAARADIISRAQAGWQPCHSCRLRCHRQRIGQNLPQGRVALLQRGAARVDEFHVQAVDDT